MEAKERLQKSIPKERQEFLLLIKNEKKLLNNTGSSIFAFTLITMVILFTLIHYFNISEILTEQKEVNEIYLCTREKIQRVQTITDYFQNESKLIKGINLALIPAQLKPPVARALTIKKRILINAGNLYFFNKYRKHLKSENCNNVKMPLLYSKFMPRKHQFGILKRNPDGLTKEVSPEIVLENQRLLIFAKPPKKGGKKWKIKEEKAMVASGLLSFFY